MTKNHATGLAAFHGPGKTITRECECGTLVTVTGVSGGSNMCDECAAKLIAVLFDGAPMPPEYLFPLDEVPLDGEGRPVSCGNRTDLPKRDRRHRQVYLGTDMRHANDGGIEELHIFACGECGRDKQTRTPPA